MWSRVTECWVKCFTGGDQLITEPSKIELAPKQAQTAPTPAQVRAYVPLESNLDEEESSNGDSLDLNWTTVENKLETALRDALTQVNDTSLTSFIDKDGVKVRGKVTSRGYQLCTTWQCSASKERFISLIRNFAVRSEWDTNIRECKVVSRLPEGVTIVYLQYRKVLTVSSRDILLASKTFAREGALMEVSTSVESRVYLPSDPLVRAHIYTGGYYVQEMEDGTSTVTAFSEMDFGGVIPHAAMMRMSSLAMPAFAKSINSALDKSI